MRMVWGEISFTSMSRPTSYVGLLTKNWKCETWKCQGGVQLELCTFASSRDLPKSVIATPSCLVS